MQPNNPHNRISNQHSSSGSSNSGGNSTNNRSSSSSGNRDNNSSEANERRDATTVSLANAEQRLFKIVSAGYHTAIATHRANTQAPVVAEHFIATYRAAISSLDPSGRALALAELLNNGYIDWSQDPLREFRSFQTDDGVFHGGWYPHNFQDGPRGNIHDAEYQATVQAERTERLNQLLRFPPPLHPSPDSDFVLRFNQFAKHGRSPIGIAQALVEHHWNTTIDQLPPELAAILSDTWSEFHYIPESGFKDDGDAIHHQQLQAYEAAISHYERRPEQYPDIHPLLRHAFHQQYSQDCINVLTNLRCIIESGNDHKPAALLIFRLVHHRARIEYLGEQTNNPLDSNESVESAEDRHL